MPRYRLTYEEDSGGYKKNVVLNFDANVDEQAVLRLTETQAYGRPYATPPTRKNFELVRIIKEIP